MLLQFKDVEQRLSMLKVNVSIIPIFLINFLNLLLAEESSEVVEAFHQHDIAPDVIQVPPRNFLKVEYEGFINVYLGNELTPAQLKREPRVKWRTALGSYYTLLMIDADVPSRLVPTMRAFNQWMVANIPGNKIQKGEILNTYLAPNPRMDTGLHRYIFLLYRQLGKIYFKEQHSSNNTIEGRFNFSATDFALRYGLGEAIAGNFYQAQSM